VHPVPINEAERLEIVRDLGLVARNSAPALQAICRRALRDFKVSTVLITLVEENEVVELAMAGRELPMLPRQQAFCSHVIVEDSALVVADLRSDARFARNILVCSHGLRSIAAAPIRHNGQHAIGAFCLLDTVPRDFTRREVSYLQRLAERAATEIWFCDAVNRPNLVLID